MSYDSHEDARAIERWCQVRRMWPRDYERQLRAIELRMQQPDELDCKYHGGGRESFCYECSKGGWYEYSYVLLKTREINVARLRLLPRSWYEIEVVPQTRVLFQLGVQSWENLARSIVPARMQSRDVVLDGPALTAMIEWAERALARDIMFDQEREILHDLLVVAYVLMWRADKAQEHAHTSRALARRASDFDSRVFSRAVLAMHCGEEERALELFDRHWRGARGDLARVSYRVLELVKEHDGAGPRRGPARKCKEGRV